MSIERFDDVMRSPKPASAPMPMSEVKSINKPFKRIAHVKTSNGMFAPSSEGALEELKVRARQLGGDAIANAKLFTVYGSHGTNHFWEGDILIFQAGNR